MRQNNFQWKLPLKGDTKIADFPFSHHRKTEMHDLKRAKIVRTTSIAQFKQLSKNQVEVRVNGRPLAPTLADPEVQEEVRKLNADLRSNVDKLRRSYVEQGILTRDGKLAKRYGG